MIQHSSWEEIAVTVSLFPGWFFFGLFPGLCAGRGLQAGVLPARATDVEPVAPADRCRPRASRIRLGCNYSQYLYMFRAEKRLTRSDARVRTYVTTIERCGSLLRENRLGRQGSSPKGIPNHPWNARLSCVLRSLVLNVSAVGLGIGLQFFRFMFSSKSGF